MSACTPGFPGLPSVNLPTANAPAAASPLPTATAELPTLTPVLAEAATSTLTFTPIPSLTATPGVPGGGTPTLTATVTVPAIVTQASITVTPTLPTPTTAPANGTGTATEPAFATWGKVPPGTRSKPVRIENKAHADADISLQCVNRQQDVLAVFEYNGVRHLSIQAPACRYVYVVYVGGRKIVGSFSLENLPDATILIYANRVIIH